MSKRTEQVQILINAKDKSANTLSKVKSAVVGIGAAYLGWRGITSILGSIIEKGREHEQVWTDVTAALKRHDIAVEGNIGKVKQFADEMQTMTGRSDEFIAKSVQAFLDYGQSVDEALKTTSVALDLAAGAGMDLTSATDLLAKAAVGYTSTLSRYGIIIDENIPKSEKYAEAIRQINERFGGAAQAQADTASVKIKVLTQKFGDLQEQLFELFSPALLVVVSAATDAVDAFRGAIEFLFPPTRDIQEELDDLAESIESVGVAADGSATSLMTMAATSSAMRQFEEMARKVEAGVELDREAVDNLKISFTDLSFVAPDAAKVIVDGLDMTNNSLKGVTEQAKLTETQIQHLFNMRKYSDVIAEIGQQLHSMLERAKEDFEGFGEEWDNTVTMATKGMTKVTSSVKAETSIITQQLLLAAKDFSMCMTSHVTQMASEFAGYMLDMEISAREAFKRMAKHFSNYFIKSALDALAKAFIPNLLGWLGSLFDTPANDRMAATQGQHFIQWFNRGAMGELSNTNLGSSIAGAIAPPSMRGMSGRSIAPGVPQYTAMNARPPIIINVHGSITTDDDYVRDHLVPAIERAVTNRYSRLQIGNREITGTSNVVYA